MWATLAAIHLYDDWGWVEAHQKKNGDSFPIVVHIFAIFALQLSAAAVPCSLSAHGHSEDSP
jgi:hypothetical protein